MEIGDKVKYIGKGFIGFDKKDRNMKILDIAQRDYVVIYQNTQMIVYKHEVESKQ